ncbi:prepilin-type N-terminal cleavage/methylation domain-containing protein [Candidatus Saccharibacteria bacterium TM7i]|nr:prepilin-type N-terminal cleavage/methylation domain-containing protein [Candidatus Saccharibacteria bacterium TM7i]
MKGNYNTRVGFTIVELLIVVIVIAILAAITIVAYNGITNRAKDAAMASTASALEKQTLINKNVKFNGWILDPSPLPATRDEFIERQHYQAMKEKLCIIEYEEACNPELVQYEVPLYDKSKVYIHISSHQCGGAPFSTSINFSHWSNEKSRWIDTTLRTGFQSCSYNNSINGAFQESTEGYERRCLPLSVIALESAFDEACRLVGPTAD